MFRDTKKELERLEAELLAAEPEEEYEEEEYEEEYEDDLLDYDDDFGEEDLHRNFSSHYRVYNADRADWDPEELGDQLDTPRRSGIWRLCALAMALAAGVFLLLAWWVVKGKGGWL